MTEVSFHEILDQLERASLEAGAKGRRFERLMAAYLKTET
jgi:predicted helicase